MLGGVRRTPISLGIFLLALLLRLLYLADLSDYEFRDRLDLDPKAYDEKALQIVQGCDPHPGLPFYQSPLYAYFLAGVYRVAGHSYDAVRIVQALFGALSALWILWIGRRLFSRTTGNLAGLVAALYAPFPFYEAQIMKTSLGVFLILSGTILVLRDRSRRAVFFGGLLIGLAALVRENALLFLAVAFVGLLWGRAPGRGSVGKALLLLLGGAAAIAPVTARNVLVSGDWALVTSQGGQNFYIGNNEAAAGTYTGLPFVRPDPRYEEIDCRREAERRAGRELSPSEVSRFWYAEAFRWMKENPRGAATLWGRKVLLFWDDRELPDNENIYYMRERFGALRLFPITFGSVAALALVGMVASIRRFRPLLLVYGGVGTTFASLVAFFVFSRYRVHVVPFLILFAAETVRLGAAALRDRRWSRVLLLLAGTGGALVLTFLVRPGDYDPKWEGYLAMHVNRAMLFAEAGEWEQAAGEYGLALEIAPDQGEVRKRRAQALLQAGRREEARDEFGRAAALLPRDGAVRNDLALLMLEGGRKNEAEELLREAIRIEPGLEGPHRNLGRLLVESGREEEGRRQIAVADSLRAEREGR